MKKILYTLLTLASAIILSAPSKNKKTSIVKTSTPQQNASKVSKETLNLIKLKKEKIFNETLQLNLPKLNIATATIIARKEARKLYNKEYKSAQKLKSLVIEVLNLPNIKFEYPDTDYESPIHRQFPNIFGSINEGIYESTPE